MVEQLISNLLSALVGGFIAGYFSLRAVQKSIDREKEKMHEDDRKMEFGLLQAIHDEIDIVWESYATSTAPQLESLGDGKPFLFTYPIGQDYFPVYKGNTAVISRIKDNDLRRQIVSVYTQASGLIDSFRMNNELVRRFETDKANAAVHFQGCVVYAKSLKAAHLRLKGDVTKLLRELNKKGVISEKV